MSRAELGGVAVTLFLAIVTAALVVGRMQGTQSALGTDQINAAREKAVADIKDIVIKARTDLDIIPIGTVISSVLTYEQLTSLSNVSGDQWVLADGSFLPRNSLYEKATGEKRSPDLRHLDRSRSIHEIVGGIATHGQNVNLLHKNSHVLPQTTRWTWIQTIRDMQGNTFNSDWQQAVDQFQNWTEEDGTVVARGRTHNFHHNQWGEWKSGQVTVIGIAHAELGLYHFIKIN